MVYLFDNGDYNQTDSDATLTCIHRCKGAVQ